MRLAKDKTLSVKAPMIRAILDGSKTEHRIVLNPQPHYKFGAWWWNKHGSVYAIPREGNLDNTLLGIWDACPYHVGDRLWVRETWAYINNYDIDGSQNYYEYKADKPNDLYPGDWPADEARGNDEAPKWRTSIHMPREASRITLEITAVSVQRLNAISPEEVRKEGHQLTGEIFLSPQEEGPVLLDKFARLWDRYAKRGYTWETNPWCWCITFKVVKE